MTYYMAYDIVYNMSLEWSKDYVNKVICGDSLGVMKGMPGGSVDMVMTSPPYWGLRDYGNEQVFGGDKDCEHEWIDKTIIRCTPGDRPSEKSMIAKNRPNETVNRPNIKQNICLKCQAWKGQLGLEPTPEMYIEHLTEIFNEVKRVLKKEGTLWLNIGDTYGGSGGDHKEWHKNDAGFQGKLMRGCQLKKLIPKCLCMIPERLAWSLIQNGWILRNKIVWYKPNAMPSSVQDRFSNRWEYIFLFSKSQRYYFDLDAVREPHKEYALPKDKGHLNGDRKGGGINGNAWNYLNAGRGRLAVAEKLNPDGKNPGDVFEIGAETRTMGAIIGSGGGVKVPGGKGWTGHPKGGGAACQKDPRWCPPGGKNPGDFFEINTQPFPEAHFAVFPEKLCEKPIKAGCPEEVCKKCGKAKLIINETESVPTRPANYSKDKENSIYAASRERFMPISTGKIKKIFCDCNAGFEGGIVLDPFCGAGTALYVAKEMKRRYVGIDIKQEYCEMAGKRLAQGVL